MTAYPSTLPQRLRLAGQQFAMANTVIRSDTDSGVAKTRRRFTKGVETVNGTQVLKQSQMNTFTTFFNTTLEGGALPFTWAHPISDATVNMRFTAPPSATPQGAGLYEVSMALEILP